MSTQVVDEFVLRPRSYTFLNSSDDDIGFTAAGQWVVVPAAGKVAPPGTFGPLEVDGELIPGTLSIHDLEIHGEDSRFGPATWSAGDAVRLVLGISTSTGQASSGYARRGLSLIPSTAGREAIEELRKAGRERYHGWQLEQAREIVRAHDEKNEIRRRANLPLMPGDREYIRAMHMLGVADEADRRQAKESLEIQDQEQADDLAALLKDKLRDIVVEQRAMTSAEVVEKLLADPKAMALLKETHKVRKHRGPNRPKPPAEVDLEDEEGDDEPDE